MIRFFAVSLASIFAAGWAIAAVEIQEVKTPEGITAWLVEEHSIPFAAIEIRFKGGTSLDRVGKRGAVNLMTGLLEEGAGDLDAQAFAETRESLAASIRFDSHSDAVSVSFQFLSENRDEAVDLLRIALTEPAFSEDAVERVRAQVLSGLRHSATDPNEIAQARFNALAWGQHPYGSPGEGTLESVAALTRDDLVEAHKGALARDRVYVGAVGDITAEELSDVLDRLLGDLPAEGAPMPPRATYGLPASGVTTVDFETPQSVAIFGHEGIPRDDPDFFPAYILNEIFGGNGFESRLMQEVRVKRGLTYGIGSYLSPRDHGALTLGQVATVGDRMSETVGVVRAEWTRIADGVTEEELDAAKLYLTGAYPLRFDGNAPIARIMVGMQMDDLPIDYIATRNDNVNAVTLEDIRRVAERIFRPDDLHFVIVGQQGEIPLD